MRKLIFTHKEERMHWVGDGFPVRTVFSYSRDAAVHSPFLMMDYAGPIQFPPSEHVRGVGEHPHRGFETVTIVYDGAVDHRDSYGGGGSIGPGDVQWMTAGSGLVHEEMHGKDFTKNGGNFEMVQLWVNLPKKDKMTPPRYQGIKDADIPKVALPNEGGLVRVIAGDFAGSIGPAKTFSPINLWDVRLKSGSKLDLKFPVGHTSNIFVLSGAVTVDGRMITGSELAAFDKDQEALSLEASKDTKLLVLGGEPILDPIAGYGPFVMNTPDEIRQAMDDYQSGKMGRIKNID